MATNRERRFILWFEEVGAGDAHLVGTGVALLGEVARHLSRRGVRVPPGFAVTAHAYRYLVKEAGLLADLRRVLAGIDPRDPEGLALKARQARDLFLRAKLPANLETEIVRAYWKLSSRAGAGDGAVVVRPSPAGEQPADSPVGLQDSLLNVKGEYAVADACRRSFASHFTERAIASRLVRGIDPLDQALALGVHRMVRSDAACSGVATGFDPRSGFPGVIAIRGGFGARIARDEEEGSADVYVVHKLTLRKGFRSIVGRQRGTKEWKWVPGSDADPNLALVPVPERDQKQLILGDDEVLELARGTSVIEAHLGRVVELGWAKDGDGVNAGTGMLYVLQVRRATPPSRPLDLSTYLMESPGDPREVLLRGKGAGDAIGGGRVKFVGDVARLSEFTVGSVLVTDTTDREWEEAMRASAAVITLRGDRQSHAARFCGDHGVPCLVGVGSAARQLSDGMEVTVDCRDEIGIVIRGLRPYRVERVRPSELPETKAELMMIAGPIERVFFEAQQGVGGVGLVSLDAIIEEQIGIHPFALLELDQIKDRQDQPFDDEPGLADLADAVRQRAGAWTSKVEWFVDRLSCAIGSVAAGSYREVAGKVAGDVLVRFSNLSPARYLHLVGGQRYDLRPGAPLWDLQGAGRYLDPIYGRAFSLECQAIKRVREELGFVNVKVVVPHCRTPDEGQRLISLMGRHGLVRGENGLECYLQLQVPSNFLLIEQFARLFDGFLLEAEDLASLVFGTRVDGQDVELLRQGGAAARRFVGHVFQGAGRHRPRRRVGFCVRSPDAVPSWVAFVAEMGADFIATRPAQLAATKLIATYAEVARGERKHLVVVEEDPVTGRQITRFGVPVKWLKDRATRWARHQSGRMRELTPDARRAVAAFLAAVTPRVQIERPGQLREVYCWRPEDIDVAREEKARGVRSVKVRRIGTLSAQELLEVASVWGEQARAGGRKVPAVDSARTRGLVKRFEHARAEFIAQTSAAVLGELFRSELRQG
jgi:pyruvate,water dikinase